MVGRTAFAVLLIALSGCAGFGDVHSDHVAISGQGQKSGTETRTLDCPAGKGTIAVGGQGQGTLTITVTDSAGAEIFRKAFNGNEQGGESKSLSGAGGNWTLRVQFAGAFGVGAWNGQYGISLTCSG